MRGSASEFRALAADFAAASAATVPAARVVMTKVGKELATGWAANARQTSGTHGKHYPDSIDSELAPIANGVAVDVGPNAAKPQGSMGAGFEYGSVNQPPHLDGLRALDAMQESTGAFVEVTFGRLIP